MTFDMKIASVRNLRQNFPRVLAWLQAGEEVVITLRRQRVARLVPWPKKKSNPKPIPDISARLLKVFGQKVLPDETIKAIVDLDRSRA